MKRLLLLLPLVALAALAVLFAAAPEPAPGPVGGWMAAAGVTPAHLDLDGVRVRYVRAGSGPPVVLLHGFASSIYTWKDVLPALSARHDVVALDFPGFGGSAIPRPLDAGAYPALVTAAMDRLGIARASLVGNSLGGGIAVLVAADHPERVDRVVLLDAAGFNLEPADRPWLLRAAGHARMAPLLERARVRRRLVALALRQVIHDDALVTEERVDEYTVPLMRRGAIAAGAELLRRPIPGGVVGKIARVRAPTLVIWGREDRWIPLEHTERFTAAIPGARALVLDGCGHMPQEEKPAETARAVLEFLGESAGPAPVIRPGAD